jgi:RNA polymerase sigma factor (sigma-70 family)
MNRSANNPFERLIAEQYTMLQAFFLRRIRNRSDAADLVQEVYARLLRVNDPEAIRNPQAYLFTVAGNLAKEQALVDGRASRTDPISDASIEEQLSVMPDLDNELDRNRRVRRLSEVLDELTPKCRAVVAMRYQHAMSNQEIASKVGISTHMVKKYLAQALLHGRRRMQRMA